jgi:predicted nucleotidyltransferase
VIERHLASTLQAIHLYGSAIDGLKPHSDIDLLVTVSARPDESIRQALLLDLLTVSVLPGEEKTLRALEVTVIAHNAEIAAEVCEMARAYKA